MVRVRNAVDYFVRKRDEKAWIYLSTDFSVNVEFFFFYPFLFVSIFGSNYRKHPNTGLRFKVKFA